METVEIHSKAFVIRWAEAPAGAVVQWRLTPLKKSINFGVFRVGAGGPDGGNSAALESGKSDSIPLAKRLDMAGFESVAPLDKIAGNDAQEGSYAVPPGQGGMFSFVFDNTFSLQTAKTVTFTFSVTPGAADAAGGATGAPNIVNERRGSERKGSERRGSVIAAAGAGESGSGGGESAENLPETSSDGRYLTGSLLKKRRKKLQGFARRYFSLDMRLGLLNYYLDQKSSYLRGVMPIKICDITVNEPTRDITLDSGVERWQLRASNTGAFEAWVAAFQAARASTVGHILSRQVSYASNSISGGGRGGAGGARSAQGSGPAGAQGAPSLLAAYDADAVPSGDLNPASSDWVNAAAHISTLAAALDEFKAAGGDQPASGPGGLFASRVQKFLYAADSILGHHGSDAGNFSDDEFFDARDTLNGQSYGIAGGLSGRDADRDDSSDYSDLSDGSDVEQSTPLRGPRKRSDAAEFQDAVSPGRRPQRSPSFVETGDEIGVRAGAAVTPVAAGASAAAVGGGALALGAAAAVGAAPVAAVGAAAVGAGLAGAGAAEAIHSLAGSEPRDFGASPRRVSSVSRSDLSSHPILEEDEGIEAPGAAAAGGAAVGAAGAAGASQFGQIDGADPAYAQSQGPVDGAAAANGAAAHGGAADGAATNGAGASAPAEPPLYPLPHDHVARRTDVPRSRNAPPSLISMIRKSAGKDLTSITAPVTSNEPMTALQRLGELFEYSELLDAAAAAATPGERCMLVAVFAISQISSMRCKERALRKPFNPLLGETFELVREDKGFRFFSEKISHRPPIFATVTESAKWKVLFTSRPHQKIWGKSAEITDTGVIRVELLDAAETLEFMTPDCFLRNLIAGEKYVEPVGTISIDSSAGVTAVAEFKGGGMFSGRSEELKIFLQDDPATLFEGKWTEGMWRSEGGKRGEPVWKVGPLLPTPKEKYGWTPFAASLNQITALEEGRLPPTDSRLREDQRLYEKQDDVDAADKLKLDYEQKQRERRKAYEDENRTWEPVFFASKPDAHGTFEPITGNTNYWSRRARGDWSGVTNVLEL